MLGGHGYEIDPLSDEEVSNFVGILGKAIIREMSIQEEFGTGITSGDAQVQFTDLTGITTNILQTPLVLRDVASYVRRLEAALIKVAHLAEVADGTNPDNFNIQEPAVIKSALRAANPSAKLLPDMDEALLGYGKWRDDTTYVAIYSRRMCVAESMARGRSRAQAESQFGPGPYHRANNPMFLE